MSSLSSKTWNCCSYAWAGLAFALTTIIALLTFSSLEKSIGWREGAKVMPDSYLQHQQITRDFREGPRLGLSQPPLPTAFAQ